MNRGNEATSVRILPPMITRGSGESARPLNPAPGHMHFRLDLNAYEVWDGTAWTAVGSGGGSGPLLWIGW